MKDIKDIELKQMKDLNNWKEITKGLYRFVVGTSVCYELHINIYEHNTPVLMANASLFLVGEICDKWKEIHTFCRIGEVECPFFGVVDCRPRDFKAKPFQTKDGKYILIEVKE